MSTTLSPNNFGSYEAFRTHGRKSALVDRFMVSPPPQIDVLLMEGTNLGSDNPPYMELVIEAMDESGPCGLPTVSVAHYGEQNGDLMRDPEMCFELGFAGGAHLNPFYWRNDYVGIEQWSRFIREGNYYYHTQLQAQHERFAKTWDNNLRQQGFAEVFTDKCIVG